MWVIEKKEKKVFGASTKVLSPSQLKKATSPLAWRILRLLAEKPHYPRELSRKLKVHEQKIYYHIRNLEKSGLVKIIKKEESHGIPTKVYSITKPAFTILLKPLEYIPKTVEIKSGGDFFKPFIVDGALNSKVIIGSPESHRATRVRARDAAPTADLTLFMGTFLSHLPKSSVKLDTEIRRRDLRDNLIIIGGPGVNTVTAEINPKLPIRFKEAKNRKGFYVGIYSTISRKFYPDEECALIVKTENPFDKSKKILVIAGRRGSGTRAGVLTFLQKFDDICRGNIYNRKIYAKVVCGVDANADGVIDSVEISE